MFSNAPEVRPTPVREPSLESWGDVIAVRTHVEVLAKHADPVPSLGGKILRKRVVVDILLVDVHATSLGVAVTVGEQKPPDCLNCTANVDMRKREEVPVG